MDDQASAQAATKIQSNFRGFQDRKYVDTIKYDKQRQTTTQFVSKNKIRELLNHLLSLALYHQPDDLRGFLAEELARLAAFRQTTLFEEEDLNTMFDMIDITRRKTISGEQLRNACINLGANAAEVSEKNIPSGERITKERFKEVVGKALRTQNYWAMPNAHQ